MAIDWGGVFTSGIGVLDIFSQYKAGQTPSGLAAPQPLLPPYLNPSTQTVAIDPRTGKVRCTRRRGRAMLTPTNMALMHQIGTLPNNANVRIALSKAIRKG